MLNDYSDLFSCNYALYARINPSMLHKCLLFSLIFIFCAKATAHDDCDAHGCDQGGHTGSSEAITSDLLSVVLQRFADMDFQEIPMSESSDTSGVEVMLKKKGRIFSLFMGNKHYEFSQKVTESDDILRLMSLLYLHEARKACSTCVLPDPEILEEALENNLDAGWGSRAFVSTGDLLFEDFGGIAADVGWRKGKIFAILKILGEIAEQFLTGGWHFVCEAVTVLATFATGPINFVAKSVTVPPFYGNSRFLSSLRYMSAAMVTKSILKRIDFKIKPFTVNDQALSDFLIENEDRKARHKVFEITSKALNFIRLRGASQKVLDWSEHDQKKANRVNRFIKDLESQQERLQRKLDKNGNLSDDERALLEADIKTVVTLKRKSFLGLRYKRTFLLLKRKGVQTTGPFTQTNNLFKKSAFWYVPLEMEILNPHLNYTNSDRDMMERFDTSALSEETLWLARDVSGDRETLALGKMLDAVRGIFDESLPRRQRQLLARRTGSYINTTLPDGMKQMMSLKLKELRFRKEGFSETFSAWFSKFGARKRFSTYFQLLDNFAFYLNFAAVSKNLDDPTMNLHMADHINDVMMSYGRIAKAFNAVQDKESLQNFSNSFDQEIRHLRTLQPWREKSLKPTGMYNTFLAPVFNPFLNLIRRKEENQCLDLYQPL